MRMLQSDVNDREEAVLRRLEGGSQVGGDDAVDEAVVADVSVHFCAAHLRYVLFCAISRLFLRFRHDFQYRSCDFKTSCDSVVLVNFRDFQAAISHHGAQK